MPSSTSNSNNAANGASISARPQARSGTTAGGWRGNWSWSPHIIVALGAIAVLALAGKALPISQNRGETHFGHHLGFITVHPSSILRLREADARAQAFDAFVADLRQVRRLADTLTA